MNGKMRLFGKLIPVWIVAGAMILTSAGAATGVVMSGKVTGTFTATVSQALTVFSGIITGANASLLTVSDDGTEFHAAAEIHTGDKYKVKLWLSNGSGEPLIGELTLVAPDGITLDVREASGGDIVPNIVRTGPFTWKFKLLDDASVGGPAASIDMIITIALADNMPPGFYAIDGTMKQVNV